MAAKMCFLNFNLELLTVNKIKLLFSKNANVSMYLFS